MSPLGRETAGYYINANCHSYLDIVKAEQNFNQAIGEATTYAQAKGFAEAEVEYEGTGQILKSTFNNFNPLELQNVTLTYLQEGNRQILQLGRFTAGNGTGLNPTYIYSKDETLEKLKAAIDKQTV